MTTNIIQEEKKKINFKLIIIIIIFIITIIGAICFSKNRIESGSVWYFFDDINTGFLGTNPKEPIKHYQLDTYDEYMKMYNSIGLWAQKSSKNTANSDFDLIAELIRQAFTGGDYTEDFFEKNTLLLVENFTYGTVALEQEIENIRVNDNILTVHLCTRQEETINRGKCIIHLITIPKKSLENVNVVEVYNTNKSQEI